MSLLVKIASFQVVEVINEKTTINLLFETENGILLSETAMRLVDTLKQNVE
jgi:hypothetical protein